MSVAENKDLLRRFVAELIDGKDLAAVDRYLSRNFVHHDLAPGEQTRNHSGAAGQKAFFESTVFAAFSDFQTVIEDIVGEDDLVAARWRQSSRNTGKWLGRPATGRSTEIAGISIVRIRGGKIIEEWEARDALGLFRQLGTPVPKPTLPVPPGLERRWEQAVAAAPAAAAAVAPAAAVAAGVAATRPIPTRFLTNGPLGRFTTTAGSGRLKALAGRLFMDAWNKGGDLDVLGELLAPSFALRDPSGLRLGDRRGVAQLISALRTGLPDLRVSVELLISEGDRVVSRWQAKGRHTGELLGVGPTRRPVTATGISILRADQAQFLEEWSLWEQLALLQQIGGFGQGPPG